MSLSLKSAVRARHAHAFVFLLSSASSVWCLAACSSSSSGNPDAGDDAAGSSSGSNSSSGSGSGSGGSSGSGSGGSGGSSGSSTTDAGGDASLGQDAGGSDAGTGDGGVRDIGSCCSAQTTPGCGDPNVELCVCQMNANCCTQAWSLGCALLVQQKYCQAGVRDCVCGTDVDAGQWGQTACCSTDWNSTCDSVATLKCGAAQGCF